MVLQGKQALQDKTAWMHTGQTGAQDKTARMVLQGKQALQDKIGADGAKGDGGVVAETVPLRSRNE
jgi:hypothetical protein